MVEWRLGDTNEIVTDGTKYTLTGEVEQKSSKDVFRVLSNLTIRNPIIDHIFVVLQILLSKALFLRYLFMSSY